MFYLKQSNSYIGWPVKKEQKQDCPHVGHCQLDPLPYNIMYTYIVLGFFFFFFCTSTGTPWFQNQHNIGKYDFKVGRHLKPPKFENIFVAVITFSPFLLCK